MLTCCSTAKCFVHLKLNVLQLPEDTFYNVLRSSAIFKLLCFQKIGERDYYVTHSSGKRLYYWILARA